MSGYYRRGNRGRGGRGVARRKSFTTEFLTHHNQNQQQNESSFGKGDRVVMTEKEIRGEERVLSISYSGGLMGAAIYEEETKIVRIMKDLTEDNEFVGLKSLIENANPTIILANKGHDMAFLHYLTVRFGGKTLDDDMNLESEVSKQEKSSATEETQEVPSWNPEAHTTDATEDDEDLEAVDEDEDEMEEEEDDSVKLIQLSNNHYSYEKATKRISEMFNADDARLTFEERQLIVQFRIDVESVNMIRALGALLSYMDIVRLGVEAEPLTVRPPIKCVKLFVLDQMVEIDANTYRALDILPRAVDKQGSQRGNQEVSLLSLCDRCRSSVGKHRLRKWFMNPTTNHETLRKRQRAISFFSQDCNMDVTARLGKTVARVRNLGTIFKRFRAGTANVTHWEGFMNTLDALVNLIRILRSHAVHVHIIEDHFSVHDMDEIRSICVSVIDLAESKAEDRVVVGAGNDALLDECKFTYRSLPSVLTSVAEKAAHELGLEGENCTCVYVPIVGYLLSLPAGFPTSEHPEMEVVYSTHKEIRVTSPITDELNDHIGDIRMRIIDKESVTIRRLKRMILRKKNKITHALTIAAQVDAIISLALVARDFSWTCPELVPDATIEATNLSHPIVIAVSNNKFVTNSVCSGSSSGKVKIITGPNACGKSIYMKQVGILAFLTHIGSFVPATRARVGPIDRIVTRMFTVDTVLDGMSTFAIDVDQVAVALRRSTQNSLVIIDEFGKGTMMEVGLSLLASCLTYWIEKDEKCPHVFVASHFHSLVQYIPIENDLVNFQSFEVSRSGRGRIQYKFRLVEGLVDCSFAMNIAKDEGVPIDVIERSCQIYGELKNGASCSAIETVVDESEHDEIAKDFDFLMKEMARTDEFVDEFSELWDMAQEREKKRMEKLRPNELEMEELEESKDEDEQDEEGEGETLHTVDVAYGSMEEDEPESSAQPESSSNQRCETSAFEEPTLSRSENQTMSRSILKKNDGARKTREANMSNLSVSFALRDDDSQQRREPGRNTEASRRARELRYDDDSSYIRNRDSIRGKEREEDRRNQKEREQERESVAAAEDSNNVLTGGSNVSFFDSLLPPLETSFWDKRKKAERSKSEKSSSQSQPAVETQKYDISQESDTQFLEREMERSQRSSTEFNKFFDDSQVYTPSEKTSAVTDKIQSSTSGESLAQSSQSMRNESDGLFDTPLFKSPMEMTPVAKMLETPVFRTPSLNSPLFKTPMDPSPFRESHAHRSHNETSISDRERALHSRASSRQSTPSDRRGGFDRFLDTSMSETSVTNTSLLETPTFKTPTLTTPIFKTPLSTTPLFKARNTPFPSESVPIDFDFDRTPIMNKVNGSASQNLLEQMSTSIRRGLFESPIRDEPVFKVAKTSFPKSLSADVDRRAMTNKPRKTTSQDLLEQISCSVPRDLFDSPMTGTPRFKVSRTPSKTINSLEAEFERTSMMNKMKRPTSQPVVVQTTPSTSKDVFASPISRTPMPDTISRMPFPSSKLKASSADVERTAMAGNNRKLDYQTQQLKVQKTPAVTKEFFESSRLNTSASPVFKVSRTPFPSSKPLSADVEGAIMNGRVQNPSSQAFMVKSTPSVSRDVFESPVSKTTIPPIPDQRFRVSRIPFQSMKGLSADVDRKTMNNEGQKSSSQAPFMRNQYQNTPVIRKDDLEASHLNTPISATPLFREARTRTPFSVSKSHVRRVVEKTPMTKRKLIERVDEVMEMETSSRSEGVAEVSNIFDNIESCPTKKLTRPVDDGRRNQSMVEERRSTSRGSKAVQVAVQRTPVHEKCSCGVDANNNVLETVKNRNTSINTTPKSTHTTQRRTPKSTESRSRRRVDGTEEDVVNVSDAATKGSSEYDSSMAETSRDREGVDMEKIQRRREIAEVLMMKDLANASDVSSEEAISNNATKGSSSGTSIPSLRRVVGHVGGRTPPPKAVEPTPLKNSETTTSVLPASAPKKVVPTPSPVQKTQMQFGGTKRDGSVLGVTGRHAPKKRLRTLSG